MAEPNGDEYSKERLAKLTLARLKELREQSAGHRTRFKVAPLVPQERGATVPLSYAQERLWFLEQLGLVGSAYNSQRALRLEGKLNVCALERSLAELIRRHETLRTRFDAIAGSPIQVILPPSSLAVDLRDLSSLPEEEQRIHVQRVSVKEAQHPFNLADGQLLRVSLLKLAHQEHVLLLTTHHIVADGWSWSTLSRELAELYGAYSQGQSLQLPELPVQYADYAIWQRSRLRGEVLQNELQYWRERLAGAPPELSLPTDRPRPTVASFEGARLTVQLPAALSEALEELTRREGATLFMTVLGAYQILLSRYCGQDDVVVGSPIAGRTHAHTEALIGFFVNTLVLRTDLSGNPPFRELLRRVKEVTLEAYEHQELPFEKLVMELRPERNLTRQPIFQVALAVQNYPPELPEFAGLIWTRIDTEHVAAPFDLTLNLHQGRGGLHAAFVYATDLFDRTTIERMAGHFRVMLEGIVADPNCPIQKLPLLTGKERDRVLYGFNDTAADYPQHRPIHEVFEDWVQRSPDATAVLCEAQALTYSELNSKANQLARYLGSRGVVPGDFIPVLMPRSLQMLIAQIAVLKIGGVYVPIDPELPPDRRAFMIRDCGARFVLSDRDEPVDLRTELACYINCTKESGAIGTCSAGNLNVCMDRIPPAYVMYTSGSTGVPKGVIVPHHAVNRLAINNGYARIEPQDCVAHYSNPAFDSSTFESWGALLNGARIVIVPHSVVLDPKRLGDVLTQNGVTVLWITVGLFTQYVDALANVFGRLRYLLTGGDTVEPSVVRCVLRISPPQHLLNAYGPTECTTFSTTYLINSVEIGAKQIPIGRPISNAKIYILDGHLQAAPVGIAGEIYIGGAGVACGYLNRPELTAERFVSDPFSSDPGARLYRTGDMGRWRPDGSIEFLGRNDRQVKIRGFRIELGEIESHLAQHAELKEAAVLAREDVPGEKRLVAYVVPTASPTAPLAEELRAYLGVRLPEYMVPSAFVLLESMPLTTTGKVNRQALPVPMSEAYVSKEYEAPLGEVEQVIAGIWRKLLGLQRVGRQDNFFHLGGHSLLALKVLFEINRSLGSALAVADAYRNPTIRELAAHLRGRTAEDPPVILSTEAALDDQIVAKPGFRRVPAEAIMLTGSTGFVGRFLLAQLLKDTNAIIYCPVRASSKHEAQSRVGALMTKWDLWCDEFASRIVEIAADLRLPRLGLDELSYQALSENVDSIYHCATSMNHLETYAMAKPANVDSARELLKLATSVKPKLINYISTLSVFSSSGGSNRIVTEASPIDHEDQPNSRGYAASKWVGEKIFMTANERGIPCNIFRLGLVWADTQQGRYDELQREYRIIKSCLLSGKGIRHYQYQVAPTPVDYVARAVVSLSNRYCDGSGIFHIASSSQKVDDVFERCNEIADTSLQLLPLYDWICEIKRLHRAGKSLPVVPLIEFAFGMNEESFYEHQCRTRATIVRFDCARTHRQLEEDGIISPVWNNELLKLSVDSMVSRDEELRSVKDHKNNQMFTEER